MSADLQTMADRIRDAMGADTPYDVERRLKARGERVSPPSIYAWLAGGDVKESNLVAFAAEYGVTPAWLRYGVGERAAATDMAREGARLMEALPDEVRQETLDFIGYKLSRPTIQVAEETRASYARFLEAVRDDMARKAQNKT